MKAVAHSFGKVILLGEHAVVFGRPALAAALPYGITIRAAPMEKGGIQLSGAAIPNDPRVAIAVECIASRVGVRNARVQIDSELPPGGGLGSSAAFAVALTRALAVLGSQELDPDRLFRIAQESEMIFHSLPSGVDPAVSARGGIIQYWKGPPPRTDAITPKKQLSIVVGLTGRSRDTGRHVLSLAQRLEEKPATYEPLIDRLGELAMGGADDVRNGDLEELGAKMNEAHSILAECGVSTAELDAIVRAARDAGALGAKLTGAGGGGAAIALTNDPRPVIRAIQALGFKARFAQIDAG